MNNCTFKVLVPDYVSYLLGSLGGIITILAVTGNLFMLFYIVKKKRNSSMYIFKIMITVSVIANVIGLPLETANIILKTNNLVVNLISNFILFFSFSFSYHCITCHVFERYLVLNGKTWITTAYQKQLFTCTILVLVCVINVPIFYNIFEIIILRHKCQEPPSAVISLVSMATWVSYCSFAIYLFTKKAINFVLKFDESRRLNLGKEQKTNLKRIKVLKKIWVTFSIIWIPYGAVNAFKNVLGVQTYETLNAATRIVAFTSFAVLPLVYYLMDKRFAEFMTCLNAFNMFRTMKVRPMNEGLPFANISGTKIKFVNDLFVDKRNMSSTSSTALKITAVQRTLTTHC